METRLVITMNRAETRKRLGEGRRKHLQDVDVSYKDNSKLCILSYVIFLVHSNSDMIICKRCRIKLNNFLGTLVFKMCSVIFLLLCSMLPMNTKPRNHFLNCFDEGLINARNVRF